MKDKSSVSKAFNKHFFDFLDDIQRLFPDNGDIGYAKNSFETIKRLNTTAIIKAWYLQVFVPYSTVIEEGNIDFFINKDYSHDLAHLNKGGDIVKMIDKIRGPISKMDEVNKQHCTKYIQNLNKLSYAYNTM
jgi:hypothetical protein